METDTLKYTHSLRSFFLFTTCWPSICRLFAKWYFYMQNTMAGIEYTSQHSICFNCNYLYFKMKYNFYSIPDSQKVYKNVCFIEKYKSWWFKTSSNYIIMFYLTITRAYIKHGHWIITTTQTCYFDRYIL